MGTLASLELSAALGTLAWVELPGAQPPLHPEPCRQWPAGQVVEPSHMLHPGTHNLLVAAMLEEQVAVVLLLPLLLHPH